MNIKKLAFKKIRKMHYRGQTVKLQSMGIAMNNFFQNPYTYFKSRYYIETSAILVLILQFTTITPNFLTYIYTLMSFSILFLLASNSDICILLATILLFTKGTLDWADGLLARIQKRTSNLGFLLDNWGALVGSYAFLLGLSIYIYNKEEEQVFIILGILLILIKALDLRNYAYHLAMYHMFKEKNKKAFLNKLNLKKNNKYKKNINFSYFFFFKNIVQNFLDERSRSTDLICLIIIIDTFYYPTDLLKYLYFLIFLKHVLIFAAGLHFVINKNFIFKND